MNVYKVSYNEGFAYTCYIITDTIPNVLKIFKDKVKPDANIITCIENLGAAVLKNS